MLVKLLTQRVGELAEETEMETEGTTWTEVMENIETILELAEHSAEVNGDVVRVIVEFDPRIVEFDPRDEDENGGDDDEDGTDD